MVENETMLETMRRLSDRKQMRKEEEKKRDPNDRKLLLIKRLPTGLYTVRMEGGGPVPEVFRTSFTSINKLRNTAIAKYGDTSILKMEE